MCLAIPAEIVTVLENDKAKCRVGQSDTYVEVATMLLEEAPQVGDFVIVHAGFALRKLNPEEAQASLKLLREMAQIDENGAGGF